MLRWQPNGHNIWMCTQQCVLAIVCGIHLCVGIALFCIGSSDTLLVVLHEPACAARVVYNPLMKTAPLVTVKSKHGNSHVPSTKNEAKKETAVKNKKQPQIVSKKQDSDTKDMQKKVVEKPKAASLRSPPEKKKNKKEPVKKNKPDIKEPVKELQQKQDSSIKNTEPLVEEYVVYIGRDDQEGMRVQALIKEAVSRHWSFPCGFENVQCIVEVLITKTGEVKNVVVQKSSGSPAYDIAARTAAMSTQYPKEVWNKKLILQFGKGL